MKNKIVLSSLLLILVIPLMAYNLPDNRQEPIVDFSEIKPILIGNWERVIKKEVIGDLYKDETLHYTISSDDIYDVCNRWETPKYDVLFFIKKEGDQLYNISMLYDFRYDYNEYYQNIIEASMRTCIPQKFNMPIAIIIIREDCLYVATMNERYYLTKVMY